MAAKDLIVNGSRWVIGNGERVHIWEDRWILNPDSFKVICPRGLSTNVVMVSDLINRETRGWDANLVRNLFLPHEAKIVLGIPLSPRFPNDSLVWAWTPNGRFFVRSAYRAAQKLLPKLNLHGERGESSDGSKSKAIWMLIWNLDCLNKIRHFMWRACRNILPTKCHLKSKGLEVETNCDVCGRDEIVSHILWGCQTAAEVWSATKLKLPLLLETHLDFMDIVWEIRERYLVVDWEMIATTGWSLWSNRNKLRHEGRGKTATKMVRFAAEYIRK